MPSSSSAQGPEKILSSHDLQGYRINLYTDGAGSYRFVAHIPGEGPIAALQVMSKPKQSIVANVFVRKNYRRRGIATLLLKDARSHHPDLIISQHRSMEGNQWIAGMIRKETGS